VPTFTVNWATALNSYGAIAYHVHNEIKILWSLSVEEQFYFLFPLVLTLFITKPKSVPAVLVCAVVFAYATRFAFYIWPNRDFGGLYFSTFSYLEIFIAGGLAGWYFKSATASWKFVERVLVHRWSGSVLVLGILGLGFFYAGTTVPPYRWTIVPIYSALALVFAMSLCWVLVHPASTFSRICSSPWVRFLGRISFGMYLWHVFVGQTLSITLDSWLVHSHFPRSSSLPLSVASFLIYYCATAALASVTYFFIERPFLNMRKKLTSRGSDLPSLRTSLDLASSAFIPVPAPGSTVREGHLARFKNPNPVRLKKFRASMR
jgi:peptidoglycan/LPS O-acetylase OafA/YrhL